MEFVVYAIFVVVTVAAAAAVWRFVVLRNSGAPGLFRRLPANGLHGWRHGVVRYKGEELEFFKLRSLSFFHDLSLQRRNVAITGVREPTEQERGFMPGIDTVLSLSTSGGEYEFAGTRHAEMALVSWVEAAPDRRQQRRDLAFRAHQAQRGRGRA